MRATLNVSPGPEILDLFAERCSKLMDTFTSQGIANTFWSFAVLDHWPVWATDYDYRHDINNIVYMCSPLSPNLYRCST